MQRRFMSGAAACAIALTTLPAAPMAAAQDRRPAADAEDIFARCPTLVAHRGYDDEEDYAGRGRPMLEFGLRRGPERGVNAGARAALIGGADFSSNVGISHVLGYPPKGTHAHSMIQAFMALGSGELGAFRAYADLYPNDCLLLVDTIDTLGSGVPNAITVFEELRRKGHQPAGLFADRGGDRGMGVSEVADGDAAERIQVLPALVVPQQRTFAAGEGHRQTLVGVHQGMAHRKSGPPLGKGARSRRAPGRRPPRFSKNKKAAPAPGTTSAVCAPRAQQRRHINNCSES